VLVRCGELAVPIDDGFVGCIGSRRALGVNVLQGCVCLGVGMYIKDEDAAPRLKKKNK
jgi:hypothetical protein